MIKGVVNKIIPSSSVDGPGNRLAIFLQGCNFNCLYCHNPETINYCNDCGECIKMCHYGALTYNNNKVIWNKELCVDCGSCINYCYYDSSPKIQILSVDDIIKEIKKVQYFISGITISGGEASLQKKFIINLSKKVKKLGLTIFLDTNGYTDIDKLKDIIKHIDYFMIDLKSFDLKEHKRLTGKDNINVINTIKTLLEYKKIYEIRTVIVPNELDNVNNVNKISKFISQYDSNVRYKLIKYRPIGVREDKISSNSPSNSYMEKLKHIASSNGLKNIDVI